MTEFVYRASAPDGSLVSGQVDAPSAEVAMRDLRTRGLTPIRVEPGGVASGGSWSGRRGQSVSAEDVHVLTSELSIMLNAGLPLDRALRVLISMSTKPGLKAVLEDVYKSVKAGKGLSQALSAHRDLLGDFYINMVRSGEAGGKLPEVLMRLTEHLERIKALRESVVSALVYPAILVVVALISVVLMLGFVVPQFEALFEDMGDALPLPTRIIVAAGSLFADWGWLMALAFGVTAWAFMSWLRGASGRKWVDARLLRLPVLGIIVRKYEVTRFSRSLGTLLGSGVPIVAAIRIAIETMVNAELRISMSSVATSIKQGRRLADALTSSELFSPLALNMVRLGEETGRLDAMLLELARVTDSEVQSAIKRALTLIEPVLIVVLGAVIAAIIVSILLGILSVNDLAI